MQVRSNKPTLDKRTPAARITAGLDGLPGTGAETRGVDDAHDTIDNDDADQGVVLDDKDDENVELSELTPGYEEVGSNSVDK